MSGLIIRNSVMMWSILWICIHVFHLALYPISFVIIFLLPRTHGVLCMFYDEYTLSGFRALMEPRTWFLWQYNNTYFIKTIMQLLSKCQIRKRVHQILRATVVDKEQTSLTITHNSRK
jgi:hypothetical protein